MATAAPPVEQIEAANALALDHESPHTKWGRPYARGSIRVLYLTALNANVNAGVTREAVELMQRFDIEADAVLVIAAKGTAYSIAYEGGSGVYGGAAGAQRLARLLETPYDCYVITTHEIVGHLPADSRKTMIDHVRQGAGLVLPQAEAYQKIDEHVKFGANPMSDLPQALAGLSADAYQLGEGRLLELRLPEEVFEHADARGRIFGLHFERDTRFSAYGRAILWAASREPQLHLEVSFGEAQVDRHQVVGRTIDISWTGEPVGGALQVDGRVRSLGRGGGVLRSLGAEGATGVRTRYAMPSLPAGDYFVDVIVRSEQGVEAWSVQPLNVTSTETLGKLHLQRDWGEPGEPIVGSIEVHTGHRDQRTLRMQVIDRYGRILSRRMFEAPPQTVAFSLPTDRSMPGYVAVEAVLADFDGPITYAYSNRTIVHRGQDDFNFVMWGRMHSPYVDIADELLAQCGVTCRLETSTVPWWYMTRSGMTYVPYCKSGLQRQHWGRNGRASRIDLDDNGVLKPGCWNDEPAVTERLSNWLGAERDYRRHGVLAYSMGDEVEAYGSCLHPSCMAAYRLYLQRQYGNIEAINESWGTSYTKFDEVVLTAPDDNEEKQGFAQNNYPRWFDRRAFQAWNMANYIGRFGRAARQIDPQAWAGPEGTGWLDDDLGAIVQESDWWILYSIPATEVVRSIVPKGFQYGLWIGYQDFQLYYPLSDFWLNFLRGSNSTGWHRVDNFLTSHFGLANSSKELIRTARVVFDGLGRLLNVESQMQHDGIVMLHSFASGQTSSFIAPGPSYGTYSGWMTNSESDGAKGVDWALKPRGKNHLVWHRAIRAVGLQFEYVTDRMMRRGEFESEDYKVLILSQSEAIGPREAQVIRKFVHDGGTVIADVRPGLYDEHCKPLSAGALDDVFGVRHTGNVEAVEADARFTAAFAEKRIRVKLDGLHVNPAIELTTARAMGHAGSTPIMIVNRTGRGRAILMNFTMATFPNLSVPETEESAADLIGAMFAQAGVQWPLRLLDPNGARCRNVEAVRWKTGDGIEVVAVYGPLDDGRAQWRPKEGLMDRLRAADVPKPVVVQLERRKHVSQIDSPKSYGRKRTFTIQSHPWRPTFVVLSDGKLKTPVLEPARTMAPRGHKLRLRAFVPDALGRHALKLRVTTPQGDAAPWFDRSITVGTQGAEVSIPIAHNEQAGTWKVEATDLYTGKTATSRFTVE